MGNATINREQLQQRFHEYAERAESEERYIEADTWRQASLEARLAEIESDARTANTEPETEHSTAYPHTIAALPDSNTLVKIELIRKPSPDDLMLCKMCALETVGIETETPPSEQWLHTLLEARHSPIRELRFVFRFDGLPYYISTHLARHIHAQPYIQTQRNDRQKKYDRRSAPQDAPVRMIWSMGAEELMTIANKRLCSNADPATRAIAESMRRLVYDEAPYMRGLLVPMCIYHGGACHEIKRCNRAFAAPQRGDSE